MHVMRNALATVRKAAHRMSAATIRTLFAHPIASQPKAAVGRVCRLFEKRFAKLVTCPGAAQDDVLAYYGFPVGHRRVIWSTNSRSGLTRRSADAATWSACFQPPLVAALGPCRAQGAAR